MDTIKRDVNPLASNMDQEEKKERGGMKGAAVAGVGAVAAVGAAAGATAANVIYDKVNSDDAPENAEEGGGFLGNDQEQEDVEGGFLSDIENEGGFFEEELEEGEIIENEEDPNILEEPTEERDNLEDDLNDVREDRGNRNNRNNPRENRNDPREDDDRDIREPREPRSIRDDDDDDRGDIDERTDEIIENDQISINYKEGEYSPLEWRTLTDQDGNEVEAMIFTDGNGGYVGLIEGEPGSGIYNVAVNPNNVNIDRVDLPEEIAFTRGDLESMLDTDGGYIAPGKEDDRMFADNDDIDKDIIVTDDGEMVAQRDRPDNSDDDIYPDDVNGDDIIEDDEIDGLDDDMAQVDDDIIADDDNITDDGMAQVDDDDIIADDDDIIDDGMAQVDDDIIVEDDNIMDDGMAQVDDDIISDDDDLINDDIAQVDEADMISDEGLDEYLGEDQYADVNEEMVEVVDTNEELVADNTYYVEDSTEMEADIYDDSMDVDMV